MEFKLLKRKCGLTCALSARNSGFARQDTRLHHARLGIARCLHRPAARSEIRPPGDTAVRRLQTTGIVPRQTRVDSVKIVQAREHSPRILAAISHTMLATTAPAAWVNKETRQSGPLKRRGHARIPRRKAT